MRNSTENYRMTRLRSLSTCSRRVSIFALLLISFCCSSVAVEPRSETEQVSSEENQDVIASTSAPTHDILFNALDDESFGKPFPGSRLSYEHTPATTTLVPQTLQHQMTELVPTRSNNSKPEPRNHADDEQQTQDAVIINHRPQLGESQSSTTQLPSTSTSTSPPQVQTVNQQQQQQVVTVVQQQPIQQNAWTQQANQPVQQQTNGQLQVSQYGSQASPSNQVVTFQHPTSINSIISEQQQQAPIQTLMTATNTNSNQQPQYLAVGAQSGGSPVYLVNPQSPIQTWVGRRSISSWLKGVSSMLANIFNRRGEQANQMPLQAQASGQSGHWIQLGPSAPHWLTQAQAAIQQFQQGSQQLGLAPGGPPSSSSMLTAGSANRYAFIQNPQQQPQIMPGAPTAGGDLQTSASSPQASSSTMGVTMFQASPPQNQFLVQQPQLVQIVPQQQPQMISSPQTIASPNNVQQYARPQQVATSQVGASALSQMSSNVQTLSRSSRSQNSGNLASSAGSITTTTMASVVPTTQTSHNLPLAHYSRYSD